jgi:hypothetical protein
VGDTVAEQTQHRRQDTAHRGDLPALGVDVGWDAVEVAKQLVGSVDEVDLNEPTVAA